jgi:hypothetical protein
MRRTSSTGERGIFPPFCFFTFFFFLIYSTTIPVHYYAVVLLFPYKDFIHSGNANTLYVHAVQVYQKASRRMHGMMKIIIILLLSIDVQLCSNGDVKVIDFLFPGARSLSMLL